jgi:hypothetical protein
MVPSAARSYHRGDAFSNVLSMNSSPEGWPGPIGSWPILSADGDDVRSATERKVCSTRTSWARSPPRARPALHPTARRTAGFLDGALSGLAGGVSSRTLARLQRPSRRPARPTQRAQGIRRARRRSRSAAIRARPDDRISSISGRHTATGPPRSASTPSWRSTERHAQAFRTRGGPRPRRGTPRCGRRRCRCVRGAARGRSREPASEASTSAGSEPEQQSPAAARRRQDSRRARTTIPPAVSRQRRAASRDR